MAAEKLEEGRPGQPGQSTPPGEHLEKKDSDKKDLSDAPDLRTAEGGSIRGGEDILALQDLDPALNMKMHLVNNVRSALGAPQAELAQDPMLTTRPGH